MSDTDQTDVEQSGVEGGDGRKRDLIFPPWTDHLVKLLGMGAAFSGVYVVFLATFGLSPNMYAVGYMPEQPIPYSHALHAGELGMDCRYCHNSVEHTGYAAVPPTQTCMGCHNQLHTDSPKLAPLRESFSTGEPIPWVKIHDLPGYAYFNHSAHVTRGVSCVSCHGRVDRMEEVHQVEMLSMGWCLECHRAPAENLRPVSVEEVESLIAAGLLSDGTEGEGGLDPRAILDDARVTNLGWGSEFTRDDRKAMGTHLMKERGLLDAEGIPTVRLELLTSCSTCHR